MIGAVLVAIALLHYLTPQTRPLFFSVPLSRHTLERVLFILPVAGAAFVLGRMGGAVTLIVAVLLMLPRAVWLSLHPMDAVAEVAAVAIVGYLVTWMIGAQERETAQRQKALSRLRTINAINSIVTGSLDLDQILNDALDKVLEMMGLEAGLIYFLDQQTDELVLVAYRGLSEESAAGVDRLRLGEGFCGRVAQSGELMVVQDSCQDPRLTRLAVRREGLRSQVIVPLKSKGEVRGVLAVATRRLCRFLPEDLELIAVIGNQIGVAIEHARLHRDVARRLHIQRRLNEVAEKITSELELERILPRVLQIAEELIGADAGVIALLDRESKTIRYPYLHNLPPALSAVVVPEGEGLAGEVLETGRPIVIEDYRTYPKAVPAFVEADVASVVAVPIVSGNQIFGMLAVGSLNGTRRFTEGDVEVLVSVGRQAGIAIENARLYENMRFYARQIVQAQEGERKRIAQELHDETIQVLIAIARRLEALASPRRRLPEPVMRSLDQLRDLAGQALREIRRFVQDLRPPVLDHLGLVAALEGLVDDLDEGYGIEAELRVEGGGHRLLPEVELVLFRIAQEALSNVRRHSGASRVTVQVAFCPGQVRLSVRDNGCGFTVPDRIGNLVATGGLGLIGMHERARTLGGILEIQSKTGEGTTITVNIPVRPEMRGG